VPSDLAYYAYGTAPALEKVRTYVQEQGVRHLVGLARRGLGDTSAADMSANIVLVQEWLNAHMLDQFSTNPDVVSAYNLQVRALANARNVAANASTATTQAAFDAAAAANTARVAATKVAETPSPFMMGLSSLGDAFTPGNLGTTLQKIAVIGAIGLGAYLVVPVLLRKAGGSRTW
jgi:hypothetical protein